MKKAAGRTKKYLKTAVCLILCLTILTLTLFLDCQEVKAFAPALVIAGWAVPEAVQIIGAILVAAGLQYATSSAVEATVDWFAADVAPVIRDGLYDIVSTASNGIANISADVWNASVDWVNKNYNVGEVNNTLTKSMYGATLTVTYGEAQKTSYLPVNYGVSGTNEFPVGLPINTDFTIGQDIYNIHMTDYIGTNKTFVIWKNGAAWNDCPSLDINTAVPYSIYLEAYDSYGTTKARFRVRYAGYNETQWKSTDTYWPNVENTVVTPGLPGTSRDVSAIGQPVVDTTGYDIVQSDGTTRAISYKPTIPELINKTANDVVLKSSITPYSNTWTGTFRQCVPEGNYVFTGSGTATVGYDVTGTWAGQWTTDVNTGARIWTGTYTDANSKTWTGTATEQVKNDRTWWETLLQSIVSPIKAVVENILASEQAQENDLKDIEPKMKDFKIWDLFLLFLDILRACIFLVIRSCLYLATIVAITPDSSLLNGNAISGIDFFKNQKIPVLNVTVWNMFSGMMTLLISLTIVKKVRTTHN